MALQTLTTVLCDTAFAFLAAFICWSAFKKFGGTPIIGFLIGLMLVSPALPNAYDVAYGNSSPIYVLGFIPLVGYQGSILTALITGIIGAKLEIFFRRVMPNSMDLIFTPFIVILIAVAIALLVLGPLVHAFEHYAVMAIQQFLTLPAGIGGLLIGFIYPIAVMTGMHHMFIMIETSLIAGTGFNPLITVCAMYGFANAAVCLAISLKAKNIAFKTAGISATITQLLGRFGTGFIRYRDAIRATGDNGDAHQLGAGRHGAVAIVDKSELIRSGGPSVAADVSLRSLSVCYLYYRRTRGLYFCLYYHVHFCQNR
ncbi:PTS system protein [Klebsiella michiganensis]|uniref:PTS system protein n=1 Tax=Klebsiella michiganensis TaxID=1134687 RepID=A0A7H4PLM3_9ENTR|nr:PTS system protein [Klebsiella michiganensis]